MISEAVKPVICKGGYLNPAASLVSCCKGCFGLFAHLEKTLFIALSHLWNRALWWQRCCEIEGNLCFTIRQLGKCGRISGLRVMSLKGETVKRETKQKRVHSHCFPPSRKTFRREQMSWLAWVTPGVTMLYWNKVLITAKKLNCEIKASMSWSGCLSSLFGLLPEAELYPYK